jgi:hypothetical protein
MDYWKPNRFKDYFLTMAHAEANQLLNTANHLSMIHLLNGYNRTQFQEEMKVFVNAQIETIKSGCSDDECQQCIQNLKEERKNLVTQDHLIRTRQATLQASVQFVQRGDFWGYVINGVGVVLSGLQVVAGFGVMAVSAATGNIIGVGFGAMLSLHGINGVQESVINVITGKNDAQGFLKEGYIGAAKFLGFDQKTGQIAYSSMDLALSAYGMFRLILKPQTFRLFYYLNSDFVRGVRDMSRFELGVEIYNDSMAIKSIYDNRD